MRKLMREKGMKGNISSCLSVCSHHASSLVYILLTIYMYIWFVISPLWKKLGFLKKKRRISTKLRHKKQSTLTIFFLKLYFFSGSVINTCVIRENDWMHYSSKLTDLNEARFYSCCLYRKNELKVPILECTLSWCVYCDYYIKKKLYSSRYDKIYSKALNLK